MNSNNNRSFVNNKKFCKVCFDAGKPENVYTNHTVKTMNINTGIMETTCVTLLALECRYCFKTGHTVKFCPVIKENNKGRKDHEIRNARERHAASVAYIAVEKSVVKKGFALLQEESDDEEVVTTVQTVAPLAPSAYALNDFPSLITKSSAPKMPSTVMSFATTAALPPKPKVTFTVVVPAPAVKEDLYEDDSDYEEEMYESQLPRVTEYRCPEADSCFSYRERYLVDDDDSW